MVFPFEKLPFSLLISRQDYEKAMAKMAKKVGRCRVSLDAHLTGCFSGGNLLRTFGSATVCYGKSPYIINRKTKYIYI